MKYTIEGFDQERLIELSIGLDEAVILRWLIDFSHSDDMVKIYEDNRIWYWVKYSGILKDIPIIAGSKKTIQRKLYNLVKSGVLEHKTIKKKGTFSYYSINEDVYKTLVEKVRTKLSNPLGQNCPTPSDKTVLPNNSSIKDDSSTIIPYLEIIDYLNSKSGSHYRNTDSTKRLIHARFQEGFTKEDFFKVIDNKVSSWTGSEFEKYIRPQTLFSPKFESYLNEKPVEKKHSGSKEGYEVDISKYDTL
jgi:uncharacterized phage protein (TIGR02220 family)